MILEPGTVVRLDPETLQWPVVALDVVPRLISIKMYFFNALYMRKDKFAVVRGEIFFYTPVNSWYARHDSWEPGDSRTGSGETVQEAVADMICNMEKYVDLLPVSSVRVLSLLS